MECPIEHEIGELSFMLLHKDICKKIDVAIKQHHGITCTFNLGSDETVCIRNQKILHFCDILVIFLRKYNGLPTPHVLFVSESFSSVSENVEEMIIILHTYTYSGWKSRNDILHKDAEKSLKILEMMQGNSGF